MVMDNSISVIIPTYNRATIVTRAVKSALTAIAPSDELLVIDDGSTDNTQDTLRPFRDRIRYLYTANGGPSVARNVGISASKCPLVAFLDSDDEWLPDKLYLQRTVMTAYPDLAFCFTDLFAQRFTGERVSNIVSLWRHDDRVGSNDDMGNWDEILAPGSPFSKIGTLPSGR